MSIETLIIGGVGGVIIGSSAARNIEKELSAKIDTVNWNIYSLNHTIDKANTSIDELKAEISDTKKTVVNAVDIALKRNINGHLIQRLFQMFSLYGKQDESGNTVMEEISGCKFTYYPHSDIVKCEKNDYEIIVYLSDDSLAKRYAMKNFEVLLYKDNSFKVTIKDPNRRMIVTNDRIVYSFERECDGVKYTFEYCQDKVFREYKVSHGDNVIYNERIYKDELEETWLLTTDYLTLSDGLKHGIKTKKYSSVLDYIDSTYRVRTFSHYATYYDEEHDLKFIEVDKPFKYYANFKYVNSNHVGRYVFCDWCLKEENGKIHSLMHQCVKELKTLKPNGLFGFLKKRKYYKALLQYRGELQRLRKDKITLLNNLHITDVCNEDLANHNKYAAYAQKTKVFVDTFQANIPSYALDDTKWQKDYFENFKKNFASTIANVFVNELPDVVINKKFN